MGCHSEKRSTQKDKRDFVIFAHDHVKHLTVHRQGGEEGVNSARKKTQRYRSPGEHTTARQGRLHDTIARRQLRGNAVDNWKIPEEKNCIKK